MEGALLKGHQEDFLEEEGFPQALGMVAWRGGAAWAAEGTWRLLGKGLRAKPSGLDSPLRLQSLWGSESWSDSPKLPGEKPRGSWWGKIGFGVLGKGAVGLSEQRESEACLP